MNIRGMTIAARSRRVGACVCVLLLAGCSAGDVEFNGKLFEMAGLTGTSERTTPKVAERTPLVVPPDLARLPEPGSVNDPGEATLAAINDPDRVSQVSADELARRQAAYCKENYELPKMRGIPDLEDVTGPAGPCRTSALSGFGGVGALFGAGTAAPAGEPQ
ncbi:MAG: hypothetical protein NW217_09425 [Hyphomicrobiaceae bacterium]|nr:hypothetical protein [Hyphomicrobiaceae bacterium]